MFSFTHGAASRFSAMVRISLLAVAVVLAPAVVLAQNGTVTGIVTNSATSAPVASATVSLCQQVGTGTACFSTSTNASGSYTRSLPAGTYYAYTSNTGLVNEIFDNLACPGSACSAQLAIATGTPIVVPDGGTVSGRNFALDPGGAISGSVNDATSGAPIANVTVNVYTRVGTSFSFASSGRTDATGVYTASGLPTGTYYAFTSNSAGYTNEIYDNVLCTLTCSSTLAVQSGTDIPVVTGQVSGGRNFALTPGGRITGTVRNASTTAPVQNAGVTVYTRVGDNLSQLGTAFTNASGVYTILGLPAATYYVATTNTGLINEIYNNVPCPVFCSPTIGGPGTPIPVAFGATVSGIDFDLDPGGTVTGTVTDANTLLPLGSTTVSIYRNTGTFIQNVASASTNATGAYSVSGLPTGSYFVVTASQTHIDEVYDDRPCTPTCTTTDIGSGTPVAVVAGATTSGINFALAPGGSITGVVTNASTASPLSSIPVLVYARVGNANVFVGNATTNSSGTWSVGGLPTGTYFALTDSFAGTVWRNEIYNDIPCTPSNVCSPATATTTGTPIGVTAGTVTSNINFGLVPLMTPPLAPVSFGARVSNFVARFTWSPAFSGTPPTSYIVEAGLAPGQTVLTFPTTTTSLQVPGVPPGRYYLRVRAVNAFGTSPASAEYELVVNADGSGVLGAPISLSARMNGSRLTVTWTDPAFGGEPAGYVLEVGTAAGVVNIATLPVGARNFTFEPVPPGVYFIRVRARAGAQVSPPSNDAMIVVGNVPSPPEAPRFLTHTVSGSTVTFNWSVPLVGTPTGYIIEAGTASGLANIAVFPTGSTATSATFTGVPAGTYYVRVRAVNAQGASVASNERVVTVN